MSRFNQLFVTLLLSSLSLNPNFGLFSLEPIAPITEEQVEEHTVVVLGGGVGGLTSALYLARAGLKPLVIAGDQPGGALAQSQMVQNWPGELEIRGAELVQKMREQAEKSGAIFESFEAVSVDFSKRPFCITLRNPWRPEKSKTIFAKTCIIATGTTPHGLGVPGESTYQSRGVYTCAVCDGSLYRDQEVAVVGGGDAAIYEAHYLASIAKKVTLIVRGPSLKTIELERKEQLLSLPNVHVLYNTRVTKILGNEQGISHVQLQSGTSQESLPLRALFLAIGASPNTALFKGQLPLDEKGLVLLGNDRETLVKGVFAVGDVCDPFYRQAITASGDGAKAALQLRNSLMLANSQRELVIDSTTPHTPQTKVVHIKNMEQFEKEVQNSEMPVIVDFYADWCGPCRSLAPEIENWAKEFAGRIKFAKVNIDQLNKLASRYRISAVPTVLYFDQKGNLVDSKTGRQEIAGMLQNLNLPK